MPESSNTPQDDVAPHRLSGVQLAIRIHRVKLLTRRYWWIVALTIMIGLSVQGYRCYEQPALYISTSQMMVSGHVALPQGQIYSEEISNFYGTQVALMRSTDTVNQSEARVKAIHPEVEVDENAKADATQEPRTSIFDLQVSSTNPEYARYLLDAIMDTYLSSKRGRKDITTNEAISAITEEIANADAEIQKDEKQLVDFEKENSVVFIETQGNNAAAYLVDLNNELARLVKEHDLLSLENENQVPHASNGTGHDANPAAVSANAALIATQQNIEKLKILRDEYGVYLKDLHPKMKALQDEINKEQKFLELLKTKGQEDQDAYRKDLELQIKNLEQQISDWNKKSLDLSARMGTYEQLKAKQNRDQTLYTQLTSSIQSVTLNKSLDQEAVVIVQPATAAEVVDPKYLKQIVIGFLAGLVSGIAIIYLIHRLDDRIDSSFDIEANTEFPVVGQVPLAIQDRKSKRVPLLSEKDKRHVLVESHRNIRSSILFRSADMTRPRSLMICSAVPGEGKSTMVSNLAITFALSGTRTLLIDADMRRGVAHTLFGTPSAPGLSEFLQQEIAWQDVVQRTNIPNLDIIPRGKVPQHPGDLLLGSPVDVIIHESVGTYEMILWDSAPLLATDDAANLCSKLDAILFVARVGYSSIHSIRSALDVLSQRNARIFGIVVNAVEPNQPGYYDRYRYKEYYSTPAGAV